RKRTCSAIKSTVTAATSCMSFRIRSSSSLSRASIRASESRCSRCMGHARAAGLWANTYSMANAEEHWAEGIQSYFDANKMVDPPNGIKATARRLRCPDLGLLLRPGCRLQSETYVVPSESGERNVRLYAAFRARRFDI